MAPPTTRADQQITSVTVRLDERATEVLEAVAHLDRISLSEYLTRVCQAHLAERGEDPHIRIDISNRRQYSERRTQEPADDLVGYREEFGGLSVVSGDQGPE